MAATLLVFGQTAGDEFVNYDDDDYIAENPFVQQGLTGQCVVFAFTSFRAANWHPLTWLSHALDWQVFGPWAGGHHLTGLLLHAVNATLLFVLLRYATGGVWPSAVAAGAFALHPLRAESVAWASERKDVLSGLFFLLTLWAYAAYVGAGSKQPNCEFSIFNFQFSIFNSACYLLVLLCFALGLLCKPTLVTLPFVLLLLDYWPLRRWDRAAAGAEPSSRPALAVRLLAEKVPLFLLAAIFCGITVVAQRGSLASTETATVSSRVANALIAYITYLRQFFWPSGLAALYPYAETQLTTWAAAGSAAALVAITVAVIVLRRKFPYLLVGWLWYLGMLVPMIGLVQVGMQSMADRYTYLPLIGPTVGIVLAVAAWASTAVWRQRGLVLAAAAGLAALAACAWRQTAYWRDSGTLWQRTVACTTDNYFARCALGSYIQHQGRLEEAVAEFRKSIAIRGDYEKAHNNLGVALSKLGRHKEALGHLQAAVALNPRYAMAYANLGNALARQGRADAAIKQYHAALKIDPGCARGME